MALEIFAIIFELKIHSIFGSLRAKTKNQRLRLNELVEYLFILRYTRKASINFISKQGLISLKLKINPCFFKTFFRFCFKAKTQLTIKFIPIDVLNSR